MLSAKTRFHKLRFNEKKFRVTLEAAIIDLITESVKEFVRAVWPLVPVYTGMARSSLRPLAGVVGVDVPIHPVKTSPWAARRLDVGPSLGKQGTTINDYVQINRNQYGAYLYSFIWYTNVEHWEYLESSSHPRVASAPWYAVAAGDLAMQAYLDTHAGDLPGLTDFLVEG